MTKFSSNRPVKSTLTADQSLVKPALRVLHDKVEGAMKGKASTREWERFLPLNDLMENTSYRECESEDRSYLAKDVIFFSE